MLAKQESQTQISADWPKPGMHNTYCAVKTGARETRICQEEDAESPQDELMPGTENVLRKRSEEQGKKVRTMEKMALPQE